MRRIYLKAALVPVAALALVAAASAASSPDVAKMNLQAADVPGAKLASQRAIKETGYSAAYVRTFRFSAPSGTARLVGVTAETKLAPKASVAAADVSVAEKAYRSTFGRKFFIATIAQGANVQPKAVVLGAFRKVAGYDQGFEVPVSVLVKGKRYYENLVYMRLDRVAVFMVEAGLRPITAGVTGTYAIAIAGHIGTELAPVAVAPPTVTGTAQQGQTLTATPGVWTAPDAIFTYQWQHCDAAGANCVDVVGATAQTYAVTPADVGTTLVVTVTASNRFGTLATPSAATLVVS